MVSWKTGLILSVLAMDILQSILSHWHDMLRYYIMWMNKKLCVHQVLTSDVLTHWGQVTHICVGKLPIIGSDNGLSPERRQAIIWTNAGILLIGPFRTNSSEILIEIRAFQLKKNAFENVVCEMLFISSRPQCVKWLIQCNTRDKSYAHKWNRIW